MDLAADETPVGPGGAAGGALSRRALLRAGGGAAVLGLGMLAPGRDRAAAQTAPGPGAALPVLEPAGTLELVSTFREAMPTGVTVSRQGRIFVCYPRWDPGIPYTVGEVLGDRQVAYPDLARNTPARLGDANAFVSVQSVVVDPADRLWILDTGSPLFRPTRLGGPKLVRMDLATNTVAQTIVLPRDVALPSTYLNDVRFDLRRGTAGTAFITDSSETGPNGIIVVDLASGRSFRRLNDHPSTKAESPATFRGVVEGRPFLRRPPIGPPTQPRLGSDGIAIGADGERLYYCSLISRRLYSVSVDALVDRSVGDAGVAATVVDEGDKGTGADGLETDDRDARLNWPDTLSVAADGHLYVIANQLHRQRQYQEGRDLRRRPYALFRTPIGAGPVRLV